MREIFPNPFSGEAPSRWKQLDFKNRTKWTESRGSEKNRPFGEKTASC